VAPEGTTVEVFDPDGQRLGAVVTGADGLFRFTPNKAVSHTFRSNLGSGHVAEATLEVDELPLGLIRGAAAATAESAGPVASTNPAVAKVTATADLEALITEVVRREIRPLRKELAAYQEKNDLQGILGGLGYICGVFGLAFFIYAWRGNAAK
jgi:nickel transport protein